VYDDWEEKLGAGLLEALIPLFQYPIHQNRLRVIVDSLSEYDPGIIQKLRQMGMPDRFL
jgi:hypothetical protein